MARKSSREKQFRIVKKNRTGLSLMMIALIFAAIGVSIIVLSTMFFALTVDNKTQNERDRIILLSHLYEMSVSGDQNPDDIIGLNELDYFIMDVQGSVTREHGTISSTMVRTKYESMFVSEEYDVLLDQNDDWLSKEDGFVRPFYPDMIKLTLSKWIRESDEASYTIDSDGEGDDVHSGVVTAEFQDKDIVTFPVWFVLPILDGDEYFVARAATPIRTGDMIWIGATMLLILAALVFLFILLLINLLRSAHRQKKVINTFLTDPVTKGHNLTWFLLRQEPILRRHGAADKKFAIIEIVFINYRNFCTCHSLAEGDQILCKVHDTITKKLEKGEVCAHAATSSFAVLLKYQNEIGLRERLRTMIEDLENIDRAHKFAFHIGVNLLPVQKNASGRIVRRKDLNLEEEYNNACTARATLSGSDDSRIAFFDQKLVDERKWVDQVHEHQEQAIKNEEFVVYYQPKYDPQTKTLRGAEALIRWNSPELGFISPGKFIPIFEKNGFITEIDHYMITHVARDQKAWLDQGLKCVPVSVNVSRAHFIESDLADQIKRMVDQEGAPRNMIEIELTESAFFDDKNALITTIQKLKEYGFMVSMDDFGAGYSSLNSLKDMPLDVLKLDADFFRGETEGGRGEIVVSEAIKLAKKLNMHTVAEGVEEKQQVEFLAKQGCDMIQGYFFSEPLPKDRYIDSMRSGISEKAKEFETDEKEKPIEAAEEKVFEEKPFEEKPFEEKAFEEKAFEEKPFEHKDVVEETKAQETKAQEPQGNVADELKKASEAARESMAAELKKASEAARESMEALRQASEKAREDMTAELRKVSETAQKDVTVAQEKETDGE
ncbi:MAG: EAL domain-containing protein [Lachnospiraceae bacterium]|nr:EAL domain-containing protein [Lachnospiraceae bacterium]